MSPSVEITPRLARQLKGQCVRCPKQAEPDSDYCAGCDDKMKGYRRTSAKRTRGERRRKRQCIQCGRKTRGTRCKDCRESQTCRVEHSADRVEQARGRIVHEDRSKYGWAPTAHYVGRSRRGAPSLEDRAHDWLNDLADVAKRVEAQRKAIETALAKGVFGWPKVQRDQALREASTQGALGARMLSAVVLALDPDADVVAAQDE